MKKIKIIYWIFTVLFALMMLSSAIPDLMNTPDAIKFMSDKLGYPPYITPFLGFAKILGIIALFIPGYPRVTEWAYAGLMFDLIGATYSVYCLRTSPFEWTPMLLFIAFGIVSYIYYHKKLKATSVSS